MKILIVILRHKGGVGNANRELANSLQKLGHQVDILSREDDLGKYSLLGGLFPLRKKIKELEEKNNYDIIYTNDYSTSLSLLFPFEKYYDKHIVCFCGYKDWYKVIHHLLQHFVGWFMEEQVVSIGDNVKERFPKSTTIYRGINFNKFYNLNLERDRIGWIKRDTESLTKDMVIEIARRCKMKLEIVDNLHPDKMNEFYNRCKVFISTPSCGGYNNSWNEAMAAEVPLVIGNNIGGGLILPIKKATDVSSCTKTLSEHQDWNGKVYRDWLKYNKFSWDDKAKELEEFFKRWLK